MKPFLAFLTLFILSTLYCLGEGTKQISPDSVELSYLWITNGQQYDCFATDACGPDQSLFVHIAHPGEKIFMGFNEYDSTPFTIKIRLNGSTVYTRAISCVSGMPGYITTYAQTVTGPDILSPQGYPSVSFAPVIPGDYSIVFTLPPAGQLLMQLFDITVIDTTIIPLTPINGRLWSKDWSFDSGLPFNGLMDILTTDSVVTSINYNHMTGINFDVTSTRNGCYPPPYPWDSSCMSRHGNHHYAEYKLFINDPDSLEYPTGTPGKILGDTVNVTRGCDGSFTFRFAVNKAGNVKLNIEPDLLPGLQPEDLTINKAVLPGVNTIYWDGLNGFGEPRTLRRQCRNID